MSKAKHTTLLISRHGNVDNPGGFVYGRDLDIHLSKDGFSQMQKVGEQIRDLGFKPTKVYTSTQRRSVQSANEIAKAFPGIEIEPYIDLQETNSPGLQTKLISWLEEIEATGQDLYTHPEIIGLIEKREDIAKRMMSAVEKIRAKHAGETVVVVSHGDPIAFLKQKLRNPSKPIPPLLTIQANGDYPEKGQVWCTVLDKDGHVLEEKIL